MANAADVADDVDGAEGEDGAKKSPLKKFLIPIVAVVVLLLAGGAYFLFFAGGQPQVNEDGEPIEAAEPPSIYYNLPDLTVNLTTADGRPAYLKLRISLEIADRSVINDIEPQLPRVLDTFQVYLRELRSSDLEGSGGLYRMKEELLRRINIAIYPAKVRRVLFQEILVQ